MTETATKRETWLDWLPAELSDPASFITREELVARLRAEGVSVSDRTLIFWEAKGLLPRPIRRWVGDKTRALYPELAVGAVALVRQLQEKGLVLRAIAPEIRTHVRLVGHYEAHEPGADRDRVGPGEMKDAVEHGLTLLARWKAQQGRPFSRLRIVGTDDAGVDITLWDHTLTD